ncbi:MAG TPA: hypothetical protein VGM92_00810, partial [Candidatus Kapabacteria bacterium]
MNLHYPDYNPVFEEGFHRMQIPEMEQRLVLGLHDERRRAILNNAFRRFIDWLRAEIGIPFQLWVDGS